MATWKKCNIIILIFLHSYPIFAKQNVIRGAQKPEHNYYYLGYM